MRPAGPRLSSAPAAQEARVRCEEEWSKAGSLPHDKRVALLKELLVLQLHTVQPPDRVGIVRKLRWGMTLKQDGLDVKAGKGTIGALLVDPTVYEDLKVLLGNARRNDAVKAIVRAAIANQDAKANAPVTPK